MLLSLLMCGMGAWADTYTLDFEGTGTFPYNDDWTVECTENTSENHTTGGSKCGSFNFSTTKYITYKNALTNVSSISFWTNRTSNNTTNPTFTLEGSTNNGASWTTLGSSVTPSIAKNTWGQSTISLSEPFTGKVRLKYSCSSTAVKLIDDIVITTTSSKTLLSIAVSGTPTKTSYFAGDVLDPAGLVVTGTYDSGDPEVITKGIEWTFDPETLSAGNTTCDVMASVGSVLSDVYTVTGLTVNVPVTLTSIAVSGTPTKTSYYVGDAFETAGLVVTGTYSDAHQAVITEGIEWTVDPENLTLGTTSVDVIAGVGEVVSDVYTVEGITVSKPEFETVTYNFSSFTSGQIVELTDLDGFVITLTKGGSTNPAWNTTSNEARLYANGSLTVKADNAIIKSIEYDYTINANSKGNAPTIAGVAGTTDAGTWNEGNKTWTGADEEVTFSTSGSAGNIGFTKLVIKYVESSKVNTSLAWSATEAEVTIGADDNVFPTLTTTPADLVGVTYESSNTAVATIAADGTITLVKEGETTITANYAGDAEHASASPASYTLTVVKAPFVPTPAADGYETVDFAALYSSVTTNATVEDYEGTSFAMAFAKPESSNTPTKYYDNGKAVRAYTGNTVTVNGAEIITGVNVAWKDNYADDAATIEGLGTTTAVVTFSKNCRFTAITVYYNNSSITLAATDGTDHYATFSSDKIVVFDDATVYAVSVSDGALSLNVIENSVVPANEGVLVKTSGTTAAYHYVPSAAAVASNDLYPASKDKADFSDHIFYMLNYAAENDYSTLGFYWGAENGGEFASREGGAYLAVPRAEAGLAGAAKGFAFNDAETDGIENVEAVATSNTVYNLNGQRLNANQKGIVIVNGKKYLYK